MLNFKVSIARVLPVVVLLNILAYSSALAQVTGTIAAPTDGEQVAGVYEAKGTVEGLEANEKLWLAVRKGDNFWPKDEAFVVGGRKWTASIDESATQPGLPYSLVLFSVGPGGQTQIADWKRIGDETHSWPAMKEIRSSQALDMVDLRRR